MTLKSGLSDLLLSVDACFLSQSLNIVLLYAQHLTINNSIKQIVSKMQNKCSDLTSDAFLSFGNFLSLQEGQLDNDS